MNFLHELQRQTEVRIDRTGEKSVFGKESIRVRGKHLMGFKKAKAEKVSLSPEIKKKTPKIQTF